MTLHIFVPTDDGTTQLASIEVRGFSCGYRFHDFDGPSAHSAAVVWADSPERHLFVMSRGIGRERGDDLCISAARYRIDGFDCATSSLYLADAYDFKKGA
jgi:hypothetical protein